MKKILLVNSVILTMLTGCSSVKEEVKNEQINNDMQMVKMFYPDSNVEYWLTKEEEGQLELNYIIDMLIKDEDLSILDEVVINNIYEENNVAYLDLGENFLYSNTDGTYLGDTEVSNNMYAIVNTLCANLDVESVVFLLDGERVEVLGPLVNDANFTPTATVLPIIPEIVNNETKENTEQYVEYVPPVIEKKDTVVGGVKLYDNAPYHEQAYYGAGETDRIIGTFYFPEDTLNINVSNVTETSFDFTLTLINKSFGDRNEIIIPTSTAYFVEDGMVAEFYSDEYNLRFEFLNDFNSLPDVVQMKVIGLEALDGKVFSNNDVPGFEFN